MQSGTPKNQWRKFSVLRWWYGENKYAKREEQKRMRRKNNYDSRRPKVGQKVTVVEKYPVEKVFTGVVIQLLDTQFMYIMPDDSQRFCLYAGDWRLHDA